ncbi:MAG: DNA-binding protein [Methyloprofundus sp.]|nr:DNA-binding protein [Methyloprofundus sp.]
MNTSAPFIKSPRLTEQEVHAAAQDLIDANESISSIALLKSLGRGSLTTITKYMGTFNQGEDLPIPTKLADFTELPESLSRSTKLLAIKIWAESQEIANNELENQRAVLNQSVKISAERLKEAEIFSDEQAKRIDEIERNYRHEIDLLKNELKQANLELLDQSENFNKIAIDFEVSKNECQLLKEQLSATNSRLEDAAKQSDAAVSEVKNNHQALVNEIKEELQESKNTAQLVKDDFSALQKRLESDNNRLDLQVSKQQISLDLLTTRLAEEKHLREIDRNENKTLREKSSVLEGELNVWMKINN